MSNLTKLHRPMQTRLPVRERGASLIMVLLILVVVSVLGVGGAQIALMSERGARNDRDHQVACQASESALVDAEVDMWDPANTAFPNRRITFDAKTQTQFLAGCGTSGNEIGLCASVSTGNPAWLTVNFENKSNSAPTTAFGTYTGRTFAAGGIGVQPAQVPRYVIEPVLVSSGDKANPDQEVVYRVTSMGFGPRVDIQCAMQMLYRI